MSLFSGLKARLREKAEKVLIEVALKKAARAIVQGAIALLAGVKLGQYGMAVSLDPQAAEIAISSAAYGGLEFARNALKRKFPGLFGWL